MNRAEIDYIGPFVKAWAAFNVWYRHVSASRTDAEGLRHVKLTPNPVRNTIMPLLRPSQRNAHEIPVADPEPAQKFKLLIRDLHVCLEDFHIEVVRHEIVERISFRSVCLGRGANLPQSASSYGLRYTVDKAGGQWKSTVRSEGQAANARAEIVQDSFDIDGLQGHAQFVMLSHAQRATLLGLYRSCDPRPMTDLFAGGRQSSILAGDVEFRCTDQQLFHALIEVIYALRNTLLHGELQPHEQAFAAYEPAYRIVMKFLACVR